MAESTPTTTTDDTQTEQLSQTSPLNLTEYNGCDHRGIARVTIDESTLPKDIDDDTVEDLNWAISAVGALVRLPSLVLTIRTPWKDLVLTGDPDDAHERAGHIRAATFSRSDRDTMNFDIDHETDAGLITVFDAVNVIHDYIVPNSYGPDPNYSMLLTDTMYIQQWAESSEHPVFNIESNVIHWGRAQLMSQGTRLPNEKAGGYCAYPNEVYINGPNRAGHERAENEFTAHKFQFALDE